MQLRTLYKGPLKLHKLGLIKVHGIKFSNYYDADDIDAIIGQYGSNDIEVFSATDKPSNSLTKVDSGEATIYI